MCHIHLRNKNNLMLWNPSIRKSREIPSVPGIEASSDRYHEVGIGLGYDELVKDYKCVKLILGDDQILHLVAVYTLGVGSWKVTPFEGKGCSNMDLEIDYDTTSVYLGGSLYFVVFLQETLTVDLVWFDGVLFNQRP